MRKQFENLRAAELHCPRCKTLRPVREKLLLMIPGGEIHAYICEICGEQLGTREIKSREKGIVVAR